MCTAELPAPTLVRYTTTPDDLAETSRGSSVGIAEGGVVQELALPWLEALSLLADGQTDRLGPHAIGEPIPIGSCLFLAPMEAAGEVFCIGLNYLEHQEEAVDLVDRIREVPIVFVKSPRSLAPPAAELFLPSDVSPEFDWEVELGVVIGRDASDLDPDRVWKHIAGYCVVNDITARDLQKRHQQWHLGKNIPVSTPMGPGVTAREALPTPPDLLIRLEVNGIEKQRGRTRDLIHSIPELVSLLSKTTTLRSGDVIATGTPAGVGFKRTPPEFLTDGDVVTAVIEGVGVLQNAVRTSALVGAADLL